jgi:hypothetical protein
VGIPESSKRIEDFGWLVFNTCRVMRVDCINASVLKLSTGHVFDDVMVILNETIVVRWSKNGSTACVLR